MKAKPQTSDPGENHSNNSKNGGMVDFTGQDPYEDVAVEGIADAPELEASKGGWGLSIKDTSNPCNGSGGSRKTIDSSKVKGSNP